MQIKKRSPFKASKKLYIVSLVIKLVFLISRSSEVIFVLKLNIETSVGDSTPLK